MADGIGFQKELLGQFILHCTSKLFVVIPLMLSDCQGEITCNCFKLWSSFCGKIRRFAEHTFEHSRYNFKIRV